MAVEVTTASHGEASGTVTLQSGTRWEVDSHGYLEIYNEGTPSKTVASFHRDHWRDVRVKDDE